MLGRLDCSAETTISITNLKENHTSKRKYLHVQTWLYFFYTQTFLPCIIPQSCDKYTLSYWWYTTYLSKIPILNPKMTRRHVVSFHYNKMRGQIHNSCLKLRILFWHVLHVIMKMSKSMVLVTVILYVW